MDADASSAATSSPYPPSPPGAAAPVRPSKFAAAIENTTWSAFLNNFTQVQYLLDHNRLLLHEINLNQESKIPESLARNILLTKELNDNITEVADLYSKISDSCVALNIQLTM